MYKFRSKRGKQRENKKRCEEGETKPENDGENPRIRQYRSAGRDETKSELKNLKDRRRKLRTLNFENGV